ncbi:uncharacterized protein LOC117576203 [Drosophila albomicans]|uniref:Uncharacterized protein LOC117576203 n=1 Tax=Drosophila albomicans TaxID=7291 RepID=A0A9C6WDP0_DROAB|nr:uncharacterized protein LOC117576203 [Drosophila albomicans]
MMLPMVPQTSPQWRQTTGNERTKDAVSVIAARNCATGTATANRTSRTTANRTGMPKTMTATTTTTTTTSKKRFQFLRTSNKAMACQRILPFAPILVLLFVNFGTYLVTCSSASDQGSGVEPQLTTFPRSTLPDRPMTTQNDLITTARNSTTLLTAKKPTATITTTTTATATTAGHSGASLVMSSTAPTIITTRTTTTTRTAAAARGATKSAQIGLTTKPTAAAAEKQTPSTTATSTTTSATRTMFISTIYPASTTEPTTAPPVLPVQMAAATALALTETDARNSIEMAAGKMENKQVAQHEEVEAEEEEETVLSPHAASADSLTKGFSIPTFLPPFPVFAAADLPAYRAAAAAAEAAAAAAAVAAAAAAAAAAASTMASETVTLSPEQQRQQMFNEQHSYLASHNGQLEPGQQPRKNLTMPVLNITAQMGNHAYMPCQIHRLSDKPVSWVRLRDGHIISVDETTFIADERFQSIFQEDHDYTWSLQIKYVQPSDAGWYECQMATEPKLSAKVHLEVITPKTELIGDQSRFVKAGSKVALHCIVRGTLDPPKYIIWFRGQKKIYESDERTGWYTQLDRNIFGSIADNQNTIGSLIIPFVRKEDSGNYTCQPSNSVSVSVDLHVLSGEYSASAIKSSATERAQSSTFLLLVLRLAGLLGGALGMRRRSGPWRLLLLSKTKT